MTKDEALNYALQLVSNLRTHSWTVADTQFVITAIKEALAQPEQKSVAMTDYMALTEKYVALKATQPEQEQFALKHRIAELEGALIGLQAQRTWVGLTDEEIDKIYEAHHNQYGECESVNFGYERAIESKLKEKNELC